VPVAWGILSTARINEKFLQGVRESSEVQVVAVASRSRESAEHYAREHDIDRAHEGYEKLLADPEVEAVYIPLPNSMHIEWSIRALEAGKHVLCEKPLSRRANEVARAFDVAEKNQRLLSEGFMYRHHPQTRRLAELVQEGAVGELRLVRAAFSFPLPGPENVRLKADLDGGALMDVGSYCVSGARLLAGEPRSVTAQQTLGGDGVDIGFVATMRCANDVLVHFDAGMSFAARDALEVVGTDGSLFLDDPWHCVNPVIELHRDRATERIELERVNAYRLEAENLSAAIAGREPLLLGREDALGQAHCIEALYEAADQGRAVTLA
jgi:D-xylose 1-dehydrogenase (NADP+, D-xylono-1,5-lactone-forming)